MCRERYPEHRGWNTNRYTPSHTAQNTVDSDNLIARQETGVSLASIRSLADKNDLVTSGKMVHYPTDKRLKEGRNVRK